MQVQQRQHLGHLRGLAGPRRQDRRREPLALSRRLVDALVVDPRLTHRHRSRRRADLPFSVVAVADHQPMTGLVDLVRECLDVRGDLGLQRCRQHRPGTVAHQLVQQRPTHPSRGVLLGLVLLLDYRGHRRTFPNQRANAGS